MTFIRNTILFVTLLSFVLSCKEKKKASLSGEDPVEIADFIEFFPDLRLPYLFNDTVFKKKENDSLLISRKVFSQFVPDSVLAKFFGLGAKTKIYPVGKVEVNKAETYLFAKVISTSKKAVFAFAFDDRDSFIAALPLVRTDLPKTMIRSTVMDKKYTLIKTQLRKNSDGSLSEGKDVYALDIPTRSFLLIMTDALEDKVTELINPIDTLPRKNKVSADYSSGKMSLVSIRDGRKNDRLSFFIHFEKGGDCNAELKGEAMIKSPTLAEYRVGGDPCVLQFRFSSSAVTLKEIEGCGVHRPLRCTFDGSYTRKKEIKPKFSKIKSALK